MPDSWDKVTIQEKVEQTTTRLDQYDNSWYKPGGTTFKRVLWYYTNRFVFQSYLFPVSALKRGLLRLFGARIGKSVNIKPGINIKYPWRLAVGDYCWIGEGVWIDNLADVEIGNHVCLSQGAFLLTGNHNYKKPTFDLSVEKIILEDGVWIGAKSMVCPGVTCKSHSILTAYSIATKDMEEYFIYSGNPAQQIRRRVLE